MAQDSWDDPVLAQSMGRATRPKPRKSYALESEESEFSDVSAMGEEEDVNPFGQDEDDDDEDADDGVPLSLTPRLSPDTIKSTARKQTSRPSRAGAKKVSRPKPRDESEDDLSGLGSEDVDADEEMELDADGDVDAFGEADDSDDAFYDDDDAHIRGGMPVPPDMSKLTKRQRAQIEAEPTDESYLQLPMGESDLIIFHHLYIRCPMFGMHSPGQSLSPFLLSQPVHLDHASDDQNEESRNNLRQRNKS